MSPRETNFADIDYGVLDIQVYFMNVYLLHYFALTPEYNKNETAVEGWAENFSFPPAFLKMVVRYQGRTINVFVQYCLAVNDKGISVYGPNKGHHRRLIYHALYHERPLLEVFDAKVISLSREPLGNPHTTWSWARSWSKQARVSCKVLRGCAQQIHLGVFCSLLVNSALPLH